MNISSSKKILLLLYIIFISIGSYLSITNGITSDEYHEQQNWIVNLSAAKEFILTREYEFLINYWDKYHGVAFQIISQPIQFLIRDFVTKYNEVSSFGGLLISKHFVVFLFFAVSGVFFFLILNKITRNFLISACSTAIYLLYPYLFGHALFNPKDISIFIQK